MEKPDPPREWFRLQKALNERIGMSNGKGTTSRRALERKVG